MPKTPTIYLETTIFNFPFSDDAPQYRADTLRLFEEIKMGKFRPFTSEYVLREGFKRVFIHTPAEVIDYEENN
jgi:hypothetical protein